MMVVIWPARGGDGPADFRRYLDTPDSLVRMDHRVGDRPVGGRSVVGSWDGHGAREASIAMGMAKQEEPAAQLDENALDRSLEPYRAYLTLVARRAIGSALAGKVAISDVVQETFLAAQRNAGDFRGRTEPQWRAWLKAILLHHLANERRHHAAEKRREPQPAPGAAPARHLPLEAGAVTPPSRQLMRRERDGALAEALARLPERYRQVVCWHHHDGLGFREIAARLGTSPDAAQKVWGRALVRLKELLGPEHDPR
jgi:RNA polymerase sigma-70 factor (ECF subfamily)